MRHQRNAENDLLLRQGSDPIPLLAHTALMRLTAKVQGLYTNMFTRVDGEFKHGLTTFGAVIELWVLVICIQQNIRMCM